jgi:hypothetical protein
MKVRALRGVCVGVERHLRPGDVADMDAAHVSSFSSIGASRNSASPGTPAVDPKPVKEGEISHAAQSSICRNHDLDSRRGVGSQHGGGDQRFIEVARRAPYDGESW